MLPANFSLIWSFPRKLSFSSASIDSMNGVLMAMNVAFVLYLLSVDVLSMTAAAEDRALDPDGSGGGIAISVSSEWEV